MKRGVLWLITLALLACALAPAVFAENSTVGTYKKSAGQNWTADGHDLSILLREQEDPYFVYLRFDGKVEGIHNGQCASFDNYRVCHINSTLGVIFDPETRRSPYVYEIKVTALSAGAAATLTVEKTKLLVGEETNAELRIKSEGDLPITDMLMRLASATIEFKSVSYPCRLVNGVILFSEPMSKEDEAICNFKLTPMSRNLSSLTPTLNFTDGRKRQYKTGTAVSIDSRINIVGITLANTTMALGKTVEGLVRINNTDEDLPLTVSGTLSADNAEVIGLSNIQQRLESKTSVSLPFSLLLTRTGNITVRVNATVQLGSVKVKALEKTSVRVSFPPLALKHYGQLSLAQPGPASVQIEAENRGDIPLRRVQLTFHPPEGVTMPLMSVPVDVLPGRNEQLYVGTVNVPYNDVSVPIPMNITLTTELGENLTLNSNLTLRIGKAAKSLTPTAPPAKASGTAPSSSASSGKTTTGSANGTAAGQQTGNIPTATLAAQRSTTDTMLIIITLSLVAGAIFWFLSMAAVGRGPKKAENDLD